NCVDNTLYSNDFDLPVDLISIYPNPTTGVITLNLQELSVSTEDISLEIYSLDGKQLIKKDISASSNYTFNLKEYNITQTGIYLLKLSVNGVNINKKIMLH
ncbi:MAG: T9SS type A sorting domain-containing protein, partial [Maribacter sp.]|nr:T9SS type A sorting domain-containing protein [Maribacter sp.]